jgi:hypothetical protein
LLLLGNSRTWLSRKDIKKYLTLNGTESNPTHPRSTITHKGRQISEQ